MSKLPSTGITSSLRQPALRRSAPAIAIGQLSQLVVRFKAEHIGLERPPLLPLFAPIDAVSRSSSGLSLSPSTIEERN